MTHDDVVTGDILDRYVRGGLSSADRAAFEVHFFECQTCFDDLQEDERVRSAVRAGVRDGWLSTPARATRVPPAALMWATAAAALVAVATAGWLGLVRLPEAAREMAALRAERTALTARLAATADAGPASVVAQANLPVIFLQAQRDVNTVPSSVLPAGSSEVVLWIDAPASPTPARLVVQTERGTPLVVLDHLARNPQGTYTAGLPATLLATGTYRARLLASAAPDAGLLGEYLFSIQISR